MFRAIAFLLLGTHAALLVGIAVVHVTTLNEPAHLAAGVSFWQFGRFDVYNVSPPLMRMVGALPVLLAGTETDWSAFDEGPGARPEFPLGEAFITANGERSMWLMTLARWACIPFTLLGGWICYRWARELYEAAESGESRAERAQLAGPLGLTLWCFCPNILGHGALITPDVGATALAAAACFTFWRWLKEPTWWGTLIAGLVLGLAELAKTTLVLFYPLWVVMWGFNRWPLWRLAPPGDPRRGATCHIGREMAMLGAQFLLSLYVLNLGYGFEGSLTRLGDYKFVSASLGAEGDPEKAPPRGGNRFAGSWLAGLPVPLPKNYVLGIDLQKRDFEDYGKPSYLRGEFQENGWWYYYLYALAIKVPLGTWVLVGLAGLAGVLRKTLTLPSPNGREVSWRDEFVLLCPAVVILVFVSSQTGFGEHMRYVLPCFPFVFVWIGRLAFVFERQWWASSTAFRRQESEVGATPERRLKTGLRPRRVVTCVAAAALAWSIASSLWVYPHSLSYFNELVGGPTGGPEHLIHSNVDWGQDLLFLKDWLNEHPEATPINLIYFGYFDPRHAGVEYAVPEELFEPHEGPFPLEKIPPGWYAMSVNFVRGYPWFAYKPDGTKAGLGQNALVAFQQVKPVAMAGYSIYIYHVESRDESREPTEKSRAKS